MVSGGIEKVNTIFFDFDGVVAESVEAKTEAFRLMYHKYGKHVSDKVVEHHIKNGGVSRYEKFKIYHKEFLNIDLTTNQVEELANEFSELVKDQVVKSSLVKGVDVFLEKYYKKISCRIITGTPTNEIGEIIKAKNLEKYFLSYHGSPKNKKYWTEYLIAEYNLNREGIIFLGDASTDKEAAEYSGLHFALRTHNENIDQFNDFKGIKFNDFFELDTQIGKYLL